MWSCGAWCTLSFSVSGELLCSCTRTKGTVTTCYLWLANKYILTSLLKHPQSFGMDLVICGQKSLGSLSNDDADGNENGQKAIGLISKTTTLHVHHTFLYISLPSLPDYNVKVPEFTFCRGREHKTTTFFSFPELWYSRLEFNSKNICQHLTK